jgi:hypothetical protein
MGSARGGSLAHTALPHPLCAAEDSPCRPAALGTISST